MSACRRPAVGLPAVGLPQPPSSWSFATVREILGLGYGDRAEEMYVRIMRRIVVANSFFPERAGLEPTPEEIRRHLEQDMRFAIMYEEFQHQRECVFRGGMPRYSFGQML